VDSEDLPYLSGRFWSSSFGNAITGIPVEYQNVSHVFKTHRSGSSFVYTITGLLPYSSYDVILGFAENYNEYCTTGARRFNVTVNGKPFATDLDVYDTVGCYSALVITKAYRADTFGQLFIRFIPIKTHPFVAMIGINSKGPIKKVTLFQAVNQTKIMTLGNNDTIDLEAIGTNQLSIRADTVEAITRVRFRYNGIVHTEHAVPYVINGNNGTHYYAEPYLSKNGNKTIWMDAFNDDAKTSSSVRIDLIVIGDEGFIVEEVGEPDVIDDAPTTSSPSSSPSDRPSSIPSDFPSSLPSDVPSDAPSSIPSDAPSSIPSDTPSTLPSGTPAQPIVSPSVVPTIPSPTSLPTSEQPVL
jgi:Malectin domain